MIHVDIIAARLQNARDLAGVLSVDDRIRVLNARAAGTAAYPFSPMTDVVVALDLKVPQIPAHGPPLIMLSNKPPLGSPDALHAWLPLDSSPEEIIGAVVAVASDLYVLTSDQFRSRPRVSLAERDDDSSLIPEKLTRRELQVLTMMADGLANKEIAASLSISGNTVKFHVAQVLAKLGAVSRTQAVRVGIRRGLITI